MKHEYHVLTAFGRLRNFQPMFQMLAPLGVTWHLLVEKTAQGCLVSQQDLVRFEYFRNPPKDWSACHHLVNCFLEQVKPDKMARYVWLCDDDFLEPDFFNKLDAHDGEALICSANRGQRQPKGSPHPPTVLLASPKNMRRGEVAGEQLIFSGRIGRAYRFGHTYSGDFDFIASVMAHERLVYVPDAWIWYNYLEPGRWLEV